MIVAELSIERGGVRKWRGKTNTLNEEQRTVQVKIQMIPQERFPSGTLIL